MKCPAPLGGGSSPLASWLNELRAYARSLEPYQGPSWKLKKGPNGWTPDIQTGSGGTSVNAYRIKQVLGNYLSCVSWDELTQTEGAGFVSIAKQFLLRESIVSRTEGGIAYTFTYSAGTDASNRFRTKKRVADSVTEVQLVATPWCIDDTVYAIGANTGMLDSDQKAINFLMLADSRQWTAVGTPTL